MSRIGKFLSERSAVIFDDVVGIDISDRSVQFVALSQKRGVFSVDATGEVELDPDVVVRGRIKNEQKLQIAVRKVFSEAKPKKITPKHIVVGLPESQTYAHTFTWRKNNLEIQENVIKKEVQSYIPLPYEEVVWTSKALYENKETIEFLIVATSHEVIEEWQMFFDSIEMQVDLFDIEQLAVYRSVFHEPLTAPICMIDIGSLNSHIAIFDLHGLRYSYTAKISGELITKNIATCSSKTFAEAEELKKKIGLSGSDQKVTDSIKTTIFPVLDEIMKTIAYFEKRMGTKVEELVLVGGSSQIIDLPKIVEERTKLKTRLGAQTLIKSEVPAGFAESIGLAYRRMDKQWERRDPAFLPIDLKAKAEKDAKKAKAVAGKLAPEAVQETIGTESVGTDVVIMEDEDTGGDTKKQLIALVVILLIGAILIGGSFWYKAKQDAAKEAEQKSRMERLNSIKSSRSAATTTATTTVATTTATSTADSVNSDGATTTASTTADSETEGDAVEDTAPAEAAADVPVSDGEATEAVVPPAQEPAPEEVIPTETAPPEESQTPVPTEPQ